jgi:hypothetical protein
MTTFNSDYQRQTRAGLDLLVKRLRKLSDDATKIGARAVADRTSGDAANVEAWLKREALLPAAETATEPQRNILRNGLRLLVTNLKAAMGTMQALGRLDLADEFGAEASDIEMHVLPKLEEQVPLKLEAGGAGK